MAVPVINIQEDEVTKNINLLAKKNLRITQIFSYKKS